MSQVQVFSLFTFKRSLFVGNSSWGFMCGLKETSNENRRCGSVSEPLELLGPSEPAQAQYPTDHFHFCQLCGWVDPCSTHFMMGRQVTRSLGFPLSSIQQTESCFLIVLCKEDAALVSKYQNPMLGPSHWGSSQAPESTLTCHRCCAHH